MNRTLAIIIGALALIAVLSGIAHAIYSAGYRAAQAECKEATIKTELEVKKRDLQAEQDARQNAEIAATELSEKAKAREAKLHELEDQLRKQAKPGDTCVWREPRPAGGVRQRSPAGGGRSGGQPPAAGRPSVAPASPAAGAS